MRPEEVAVRVVHVATVDGTLHLLRPLLRHLRKEGFWVAGVCAPGPRVAQMQQEKIPVHVVHMTRRVTPFRDLVATFRLLGVFRALRPTIVHTHTPKANLLGQWAARLARVPVRVSTVHGLYFTPQTSQPRRWLLEWLERISSWPASVVWLINREDARTVESRGLWPSTKSRVLPGGLGIDLERFDPGRVEPAVRLQVRRTFGWDDSHFVVGFAGRLVREKGLLELFEAVAGLRAGNPGVRLLVAGPVDHAKRDRIEETTAERYGLEDICAFAGMREDMVPVFAAMDVFALPSHREGLPLSAMEAQAMGVPVVTTDARGCREVIEDGVTGLVVPVGDVAGLRDALGSLIGDRAARDAMGKAARRHAAQRFDQRSAFEAIAAEYNRLIPSSANGRRSPGAETPAVTDATWGNQKR